MKSRKGDRASWRRASPVVTKNGNFDFTSKKDKEHVTVCDILGLDYAGESQQLVQLRDADRRLLAKLVSILDLQWYLCQAYGRHRTRDGPARNGLREIMAFPVLQHG